MKRQLVLTVLIMAAIVLTSCSRRQDNDDGEAKVSVYYISTETKGLISESYELISTELSEQINELLYMLKKSPENLAYKSVLPGDIKSEFALNEDGSLAVNFDAVYSNLTGVDEILARAAIVKTLTQLPKIEYVQINVNGNPLIDSNGNAVGPLTAEDFIDDTDTNTNYRVKLYFANEKGDALIEYDTDINYSGVETIEELAIKQLINGPTKMGLYDTIPKDTVLLDLYKTDGTCFVDFNEKFLEKLPDVTADVSIYSVVNTLVELPGISKVQFRINGEVQETYLESIDFDTPFERNLNIIEAPK
ncbi:MAG TPA: GerMN domain-containing protein [Clostridiales bacterium]|nr:GerMN domain-containing protein [Clostridiales bacterium]